MNKNTCPKHKTPNYRFAESRHRYWSAIRNCWMVNVTASWVAVPLRATRKDLDA